MSNFMNTTSIGLPAPILHALTPRRAPAEPVETSATTAPLTEAATFSPRHEVSPSSDEQLLGELRMLAELHRAHQAGETSSRLS
jgi:hypothetical protein